LLAELLKPVVRAGARHRLLERVIQGYLVSVIAIAVLAGVGWWWASGDVVRTGAVVTAILVVSCPCALGLAFPLIEELASAALRRRGVFVRAGDIWPRLDRVRMLVFDKTGTLTPETPVLLNPEGLASLDDDERAALLALVQASAHPLSRSLHENLLVFGRVEPLAGEVVETIGAGVELGAWSLGRPGWKDVGGDEEAGVVLAHQGRLLVHFIFAERARSDAREELVALESRGLRIHVLSGDRQAKVTALAADLGLPEGRVLGGLSPQDKARWLDAHGADQSLMLGDGANDSLAFDRALCRGTPAIHQGVLEQKADFYYLGRGIAGIRALFEVNDARRNSQRVQLVFMVAYNFFAVGMAVMGHMNPLVAAILMPVSSLLTLLLVWWGMRGVAKSMA
jgi:Cu2+-exporting ATPase